MLRLRTNGAPLSGALFVSNPGAPRKNRRKARKNTGAKAASKAKANKRRKARRNPGKLNLRKFLAKARSNKAAKRTRRNASAAKVKMNRAGRRARTRMKSNTRRTTKRTNGRTVKRNTRRVSVKRNTSRMAKAAPRIRLNRKTRSNGARRSISIRRRRNTGSEGSSVWKFPLVAPVQRLIGKVPFVGTLLSTFIAPLALGVAAGTVHYFGVKGLQAVAPGVMDKVAPVQFTIAGSLVAGILLAGGRIPGLKMIDADLRKKLAAGALVLGGGLDTYRALSRNVGDLGDEIPLYNYSGAYGEDVALYPYNGLGVDLGDGGRYDVIGMEAYNPENAFYGDAGMPVGAMVYAAAQPADAAMCPPDLAQEEGEAALAGLDAYAATFGAVPVVQTSRTGGVSALAGRPGHRWGWLIQLIGFEEFQKVCAMSPDQRVRYIAQLKQHAIQLANQKQVEQAEGSLSGLGLDLGATLFAGSVV